MAVKEFDLKRPASRYEPPILTIREGYHDAVADTFKINPVKYIQTRNVYVPFYFVIGYIASAVVADRAVYIKHFAEGAETVFCASDSITANENKRLVVTGQDLNLMTDAGQGGHSMAAMLPSALGVNWATIYDADGDCYLTVFSYNAQAGDTYRLSAGFVYANKILGMPNLYDGTDELVVPPVARGC